MIYQEQLPNGLWLLAEPVPGAASLAMSLLTPAGVAYEPQCQQGVAALLAEMVCRGAGDLDARQHCDALDLLGVQRGTSVQTHHLSLSATLIGSKVQAALPLLLDMVVRPRLDGHTLEPSRDLAIQSIESLDDEPQQKAMLDLRQRHFPDPFGRSPLGQLEHLEALTLKQIRAFHRRTCVPRGSILGLAGAFDFQELKGAVLAATEGWAGGVDEPTTLAPAPRGSAHLHADSAQCHIALAYDAPPEPDERAILQRAAAAVLSGGMSGRLFTEVREKRGLCYAVYANYAAGRDRGAMMAYAGTTAPRAQETLDVLVTELRRLSEGIEEGEFQRAIIGMKSRLVMQGESTSARAHAIALDQFALGHPRSLDDLAARVDAVTLDALVAYVRTHPPGPLTLVTVGPDALSTPNPGV